MPRTNLANQKINFFTVIEFIEKKKRWKCKCICGMEKFYTTYVLTSGRAKSCGCQYRYKLKRLPNDIGIKRRIFNSYKQNAKKRDIQFNLNEEDFFNLINKNCAYCEGKPSTRYKFTKYANDFKYNGIDRKDNNLGYSIENCASCCEICNRAKSDLTLKEWKEWLERITNVQF
jgi:hypothetical protein